jgi:biopolymer transport protein ExbD
VRWWREITKNHQISLTEDQITRFVNLNAIGVPIQALPAYLDLDSPSERKEVDQQSKGIPMDSTNNQLLEWVRTTQLIFSSNAPKPTNPLVALKGDGNVKYTTMDKVIKVFQSPTVKINRFKMITDLEESRL